MAVQIGISNAVVPVTELQNHARQAVATLVMKPAAALAKTKSLMRYYLRISDQMTKEGDSFAERLKSAEAKEAFAAFREKRAPEFLKLTERSSGVGS